VTSAEIPGNAGAVAGVFAEAAAASAENVFLLSAAAPGAYCSSVPRPGSGVAVVVPAADPTGLESASAPVAVVDSGNPS